MLTLTLFKTDFNTQGLNFCNSFGNKSSAYTKLIKTKLRIIGKSEGFLVIQLRPALKTGLPLMKNVLKLIAKSVLTTLRLKTAASETNKFGPDMTTSKISNEEMDDVMKIIKSFEKSSLSAKRICKAIKIYAKE